MSITAKPKKRGRPATGRDPMMGFRASPVLRAAITKWAERQPDTPTLSEATRRLVEIGLARPQASRTNTKPSATKAADLAAKQIDRLVDTSAPPEEQASRKRRLLKGPEEFRQLRVDRPKTKK